MPDDLDPAAIDPTIATAMATAIAESVGSQGSSSPNPPVGAVILDRDGAVVGRGATQPPGGPHAEVMALRDAGPAARGGTAVVTLEPCNHTGRTGPCARALIDAGVAAVRYAVPDLSPVAGGGAATLRAAGIDVVGDVARTDAEAGPLRHWLFRQRVGRPFVTAKIASTLDGRIAAPDGTSQWITGPRARAAVHEQRARLDAIVVGTGTVIRDDPSLTARHADGHLYPHQPTRVAMGRRRLPADARVADDAAPFVQVGSHDPADVLAALPDALWVLVEGGPAIIGAFLAADLVDEVDLFLAPTILGAGAASIDIPSVQTLTDARGFSITGVDGLDPDVRIRLGRPTNPT
ncbi:bifunctional diaminohydroxyphosphoribosylaminopyrimidine deaminase/5-amino-6-(5-phosphoribosylamino)uracil reductase RibD [Gordonia soli]|uniref:Riboflavin biosynthesis protein RibD n=1 Tax=Gordonia soli NBRC 108243 TaxID=1223545 RepID=M0QKH2_9ACTN|nr:bifunctional diaminohydroxyphosphoribosylaminopyrimidine deaminase/5-amino-6-(5-phosphoribosylamino)uracil reductase RibD [Gordonia soli]GAC68781.1 riboflavin biosynthesis protein RibD [Gordonia soli NBRC 108243]